MSGKVVEFTRRACPCGWKFPDNIQVVVLDDSPMPQVGDLQYDCPECGRHCATSLRGHKVERA